MDDGTIQAKTYVEQMRSKGRSDETIRAELLRAGWQERQITLLLATDKPTRRQQEPVHAGICPYCRNMVKLAARYVLCAVCRTPHHDECWQANGGCTVYGCATTEGTMVGGGTAADTGAEQIGHTSIHQAAMAGDLQTVADLLARGADVHAKDKDGDTPLHVAAAFGSLNVVRALLAGGANVDARGKWNATPLHKACAPEVVQTLLDAGADINAKDDLGGFTPLHRAAHLGETAKATALLRAGADRGRKDASGSSPLALALDKGDAEMIELLRGSSRPTNVTAADLLPSISAGLPGLAAANQVALIGEALDVGADPNARTQMGMTSLHMAAISGSVAAAQLLTQRGADVAARDTSGKTPLHLAALHGQSAVVVALLDAGANPNATDSNGITALHSAAMHGDTEIATLLLARGANANIRQGSGFTAADFAASQGHTRLAALIRQYRG